MAFFPIFNIIFAHIDIDTHSELVKKNVFSVNDFITVFFLFIHCWNTNSLMGAEVAKVFADKRKKRKKNL